MRSLPPHAWERAGQQRRIDEGHAPRWQLAREAGESVQAIENGLRLPGQRHFADLALLAVVERKTAHIACCEHGIQRIEFKPSSFEQHRRAAQNGGKGTGDRGTGVRVSDRGRSPGWDSPGVGQVVAAAWCGNQQPLRQRGTALRLGDPERRGCHVRR